MDNVKYRNQPEVEVELYVCYTIGKKIKVKVSDYTTVKSDEGWPEYDFDDTDFWPYIEKECPIPKGFDEIGESWYDII